MSDTEFTHSDELEKLTDVELERIVIQGMNLHIHMSKASIAKRILENRRQKKQLEVAENVETMTKQLKNSHKELLSLVSGLGEIVNILEFFKKRWFPKQPMWVRIGSFVFSTIILGIALNLVADWIAKFVLKW